MCPLSILSSSLFLPPCCINCILVNKISMQYISISNGMTYWGEMCIDYSPGGSPNENEVAEEISATN